MQNAKNHSRLYPLHHFVLTPMALTLVVWSFVNLINGENPLSERIYFLLMAMSILLASFIARIFAIKNQDRIIRLEMRQRYFELAGTSFKEKEKQLRLSQIIALRFASDEELLQLMDRAIAEKLSNKDIKLAIQHWQADVRRV